MKTPLFIDQCYQFEHSPGAEVSRAFVGAMDPKEWNPIVYASDRKPLVEDKAVYVTLTHQKGFYKYPAAAIRRFFPDLTWLPGYEWPAWGKNVTKQILNDLDKGLIKPDFIHSVCYHIANHCVALRIKRATGLPWVMNFYDPWADNPYRPFKTEFYKRKDWAMEREAVENADLIIHDNEIIAELWRKRYGDEIGRKIVVLPLTVPLPKIEVTPRRTKITPPLVISHIGKFYSNRNAKPFIKAVSQLIQHHPEYRKRLLVNFVGWVIEEDKELIKKEGLEDIFKLHGMLPAAECDTYYQQSDVFLAVDGINPDNIFFPSKILKYFYYQRPILGITPSGSVLDSELKMANQAVFDNYDINGIEEYLIRAITDYQSVCDFKTNYWERFKPQNVVAQYKCFVENLLDSSNRLLEYNESSCYYANQAQE